MSLLEWIGLGSINSLWFSAPISIVSSLLAFVARDSGHVPGVLKLLTWLTIVPIVISITMAVVVTIVMSIGVIGSESTIGGVTMRVMVITPAEVASRLVEIVASSVFRVVLLVRNLRVGLAAAKLPLTVLFLPDIVVQGNGLIK